MEIRDKDGQTLINYEFVVESMKRKTINLSEILNQSNLKHDFGTFMFIMNIWIVLMNLILYC